MPSPLYSHTYFHHNMTGSDMVLVVWPSVHPGSYSLWRLCLLPLRFHSKLPSSCVLWERKGRGKDMAELWNWGLKQEFCHARCLDSSHCSGLVWSGQHIVARCATDEPWSQTPANDRGLAEFSPDAPVNHTVGLRNSEDDKWNAKIMWLLQFSFHHCHILNKYNLLSWENLIKFKIFI